MRDKRPVDELSIEELEKILAIRKREEREKRLDRMKRSGRVVGAEAATPATVNNAPIPQIPGVTVPAVPDVVVPPVAASPVMSEPICKYVSLWSGPGKKPARVGKARARTWLLPDIVNGPVKIGELAVGTFVAAADPPPFTTR